MATPNEHFMDRIRRLPHDMRQYVEKRLELFMIESGEKLANVLAKSSSALVTGLIALMGVLFLLLALAFFLGELLGSMALGFSIVAGLLFTIALIVYLIAPEAIEEKVRQRIANQFMNTANPGSPDDGSDSGQSRRPNPIFNGSTATDGQTPGGDSASAPAKSQSYGPGASTSPSSPAPEHHTTDFSDDPEAIRRAVDAMANPARTDTEHRNRER